MILNDKVGEVAKGGEDARDGQVLEGLDEETGGGHGEDVEEALADDEPEKAAGEEDDGEDDDVGVDKVEVLEEEGNNSNIKLL